MWTERQRERWQQLRQPERVLTEAEEAELAILVQELEAAEATYLTPATEHLRQKRQALESQNRSLLALAGRKAALVLRLKDFLTEARAEKQAIESDLAAVLAGSQGAESEG